ncbi:MAG: sulfur carrier protein ThiS [Kiritimatiellae bacterium]|nr:sulfur carrier protein ThiS [Kiritimatiellia bacterium]
MKIVINGKSYESEENQTVQKMIETYGYDQTSIAVAVNQEFVPRVDYGKKIVSEGDEIEIVAPMQGG